MKFFAAGFVVLAILASLPTVEKVVVAGDIAHDYHFWWGTVTR